jgi:putative oxidoreductase
MSSRRLTQYSLQLICVLILLPAGIMKLFSHPHSVHIFQQLEMEPFGRYLIGLLEIAASALLLTRVYAASGAMLSLSIMLGGLIAHVSELGLIIHNDNGYTSLLMIVLLIASTSIAYLDRFHIPFIGSSFHKPDNS